MWDLPRPGIEPASLAVADVFLGLPLLSFFAALTHQAASCFRALALAFPSAWVAPFHN